MKQNKYLESPVPSDSMPKGIPYIIGNELAERFSFYGMKTILVVFMTKYLMDSSGKPSILSEADAKVYYHLFVTLAYFFPIIGSLISDIFLGKYKTIITLSIVYCLGHLALALDDTRIGLSIGLTLIAIGSGGIKPCVSAHVGDQFGVQNSHLLSKVFGWFYFSINLGAFVSSLLTPILLNNYGPHLAFGIPGLLMLLATIIFWVGRYKFIHIHAGGVHFFKETLSKDGLVALGKIIIIFFFVSMFWSLFEQTGSSWVLQANKMDRVLFGIEWLPSQIQAANPILVMLFIPVFSYLIYPMLQKVLPLNAPRKILIGLFITTFSFIIIALIEEEISLGHKPNIIWQIIAYIIITSAEVMVSVTTLEFFYTQAPNKMKSFMMSFYLLSVSLGNAFTSLVNYFIQNKDGSLILQGAEYYWFFAILMIIFSLLFIIVAIKYKEKSYIQE